MFDLYVCPIHVIVFSQVDEVSFAKRVPDVG